MRTEDSRDKKEWKEGRTRVKLREVKKRED
jgi:hypothetical protein